MMTKVKLCGLRSVEDILCVNEVKADIAGVIFTERFKRHVDEDTARKMKDALSPDIPLTGVFVDEPVSRIERLVRDGVIDYAQLHGAEDNAFIKDLRMRCSDIKGFKIIKAFQVKSVSDLEVAGMSEADIVLLDGGTGEGRAFDWTLITDFDRDYILAGGLNPDNVAEVVREFHPKAVDVSSGTETDGKKDPEKMKRFVMNVRSAYGV
jgi:phosphoribosylanthranilate isomerase